MSDCILRKHNVQLEIDIDSKESKCTEYYDLFENCATTNNIINYKSHNDKLFLCKCFLRMSNVSTN